MTITEFLTARLDEDEAVARSAIDAPPTNDIYDRAYEQLLELAGNEGTPESVVEHAARHDPARVRAEVEAKRRIVEQHAHFERTFTGDEYQDGMAAGYCDVVKLLALPYSDHPDYDEAWRP